MRNNVVRIEFGARVLNPKIRYLLPLLKRWGDAVKRYSEVHGDDPDGAYYYNERANLSLLAGAAWMNGAIALEEFSSKKGWGSNKRSGRIDLYLSDYNRSAEFEAKHKWTSALSKSADLRRIISRELNAAIDDAKKDYGADAKFACVFFVPRFACRRFKAFKTRSSDDIRVAVNQYLLVGKTDLWAWCFPRASRFVVMPKENAYYPGVVLGIKGVKYWSRRLPG